MTAASHDYGPARPYEAFDTLMATDPDFRATVEQITATMQPAK